MIDPIDNAPAFCLDMRPAMEDTMTDGRRQARGLGLISGGLDSMLAARLLVEQGVAVTGIAFVTPFFGPAKAEIAARQIGFPLVVRDITEPHLAMVKAPPSGYGSRMNPCIDCHALMLRIAGAMLGETGCDFLFTGEVLGERPMSQNLRALNRVANLSGQTGRVLRPLSARLLAETAPEREGLVDRGRLLDIQGRSRRRQFELAAAYGIRDYPTPAGGCLLTDPSFSRRLKDLLERGPAADAHHIELLKHGRHFRIRDGVTAAVGRNAVDNEALAALRGPGDELLQTLDVPGPVVVISGAAGPEDRLTAARLCARYSDGRSLRVRVRIDTADGSSEMTVSPLPEEEVAVKRL
jgi:tRNA U34 2-thiouridine synthase MnmA/TrmU